METISSEAYQNSGLITDLDNFRSRYLETDFKNGLSVIYPSSEIYSYEQALFRLAAEAISVNFKAKWTMRPDYTSFDMYGTTIFWPLILFVNDVYCIEDFTGLDKILIPPSSLITEIIRLRVPKSSVEHLDKYTVIPGIQVFERSSFDDVEKSKVAVKESFENAIGAQLESETEYVPEQPVLEEIVEKFELTETDVSNKYVDLSGTPVNYSCVYLYVGNFVVPQKYGYDYVLVNDSSSIAKRISWDPSYCFAGKSNLNNLLKTGVIIKIKFLQES